MNWNHGEIPSKVMEKGREDFYRENGRKDGEIKIEPSATVRVKEFSSGVSYNEGDLVLKDGRFHVVGFLYGSSAKPIAYTLTPKVNKL